MPLENTGAEERITRETMIGWIEHWGESYDDVRSDDGAVADAGRTDPWTDQVDASRGEYVGDGVPRTFNGEPFDPLSGYPTPGTAPAPADPAAPDFLSTPSDSTTGNAR